MSIEWPEITKDTPLEEVKRIHQMIWDYTIEHGEKPETPYYGNCAACEYTSKICNHCPICWPKNKAGYKDCCTLDGLYVLWYNEEDATRKTELAKQIRDCPFYYELEKDSQ